MTTEIIPKYLSTGCAVTMKVTVSDDNELRNEEGRATLNYWLYDAEGNIVTGGSKNVNGDFCNGWDGTVNAAFNYIATYLDVVVK